MAKKETVTAEKTKKLINSPDVQALLEAGVHFGHEVKKWNPKMEQFIFTERNGIHVIDLEKTAEKLAEAVEFVYKQASEGKKFLFIATKRQAQEIVKNAAAEANAYFMTNRWIGGFLTNFENARQSMKKLNDLKELKEKGGLAEYTKKEQLLMSRRVSKLEMNFGGVKDMDRLPDVVFIVDSRKEDNAVREANKMKIPLVALVDTNADPSKIEYAIPSNDDALKAIDMMVRTITDAIVEGNKIAQKKTESA